MEAASQPASAPSWQFDKISFDLQPRQTGHILKGWERVPKKAAASQQKDRTVWKRAEAKPFQYETEHGGAGFAIHGAKRVRTQNVPALPVKKGRCRGRPDEAEDDLFARRRKSTRLSSLNMQKRTSSPSGKPNPIEARRTMKTRDSLRSPLKDLRVMALTQNTPNKKPRTSISNVLQNGTPMRKVFEEQQSHGLNVSRTGRPSVGAVLGNGTPMRMAFAEQENVSPTQQFKSNLLDTPPDTSGHLNAGKGTPKSPPKRRSLRLSGQRESLSGATPEKVDEELSIVTSGATVETLKLDSASTQGFDQVSPESANGSSSSDEDQAQAQDMALVETHTIRDEIFNDAMSEKIGGEDTADHIVYELDVEESAAEHSTSPEAHTVKKGDDINEAVRGQIFAAEIPVAFASNSTPEKQATVTTDAAESDIEDSFLKKPQSHYENRPFGDEQQKEITEKDLASAERSPPTVMTEQQNVLSVLQTEFAKESNDNFEDEAEDDSAENDSGDELAEGKKDSVFTLSSQPEEREYSGGPRKKKAPRLSDDTSILKDFLLRTQAKRAADAQAAQLLSAKLGPSIQLSPRRSPRRTAASPGNETLSPTKRKRAEPTQDTPTKAAPPVRQEAEDADELCSPVKSTRRSKRTRPTPTKPGTAAPSLIPLRRPNGGEPVKLQKTETQEVAVATRTNTRRNKGQAKMPKFVLEDLSNKEPSPVKSRNTRDGKAVDWQKELVSYLGERRHQGDGSLQERQKRSKGLGTINGTPARPKNSKAEKEGPGQTSANRRLRSRPK